MECHDTAADATAEASSVPCDMASSAVSPELGEEGSLAAQRHRAFGAGIPFVFSEREGGFAANLPCRVSKAPAIRHRLPFDPPVPLRI
jgi:hypothetical protein